MLIALAMSLAGQVVYPPSAVPRLQGVTIKGLPPITGRIAVDQFGYQPGEVKVAVISDPQVGYNAGDTYTPGPKLEVRNRDGKTMLTRAPKAWKAGATDEASGDRGWWFDFSSLTAPGEYYVFDPSSGLRSPVFRVEQRVFAPILRAATRTYYYQRLGVPHEAKHAGAWAEKASHLEDQKARAVWAKDDASLERDLSGGWMDAGDTDKYPPFNGDVLHPLLYAYEANPKAFGDEDNIPESGNGLPDILDEIKVQFDWLQKMQAKDGGVYVKMGNIDYSGKYPLSEDHRTRYYGPEDTGATIFSAANYAHAARVYGRFAPWKGYADELKGRAVRAWDYYKSHSRTFKSDTGEIKSGIANRSAEEQDRMEAYAAVHLFALTGDEKYHKALHEKIGTSRQLAEGIWSPYEAGASESLIDYLSLPKADPVLVKKIRDQLTRSATNDHFAPSPDADLYRAWMEPTNYHWGSNFVRASWGVVALLAADHGQVDAATKKRLRERAADMLHSFHGINPLSASYLTNMASLGAERSMMQLYHERYNPNTPFAKNPPPGYVVGGPNSSFGGEGADLAWIKKQPRGKAHGDFNDGWPKNSWELSEPAIYYQAMYVRLCSAFAR